MMQSRAESAFYQYRKDSKEPSAPEILLGHNMPASNSISVWSSSTTALCSSTHGNQVSDHLQSNVQVVVPQLSKEYMESFETIPKPSKCSKLLKMVMVLIPNHKALRTSKTLSPQPYSLRSKFSHRPNTLDELYSLGPAWAMHYVKSRHNPQFQKDGLDCWMKHPTKMHRLGYIWVDLRTTRNPVDHKHIGRRVYLHQLAVMAAGPAGNGSDLGLTSAPSKTHEVSHLCHNPCCFNPDHVVVETRSLNRLRKTCAKKGLNGKGVLQCPHGINGGRSCIFPRRSSRRHGHQQ